MALFGSKEDKAAQAAEKEKALLQKYGVWMRWAKSIFAQMYKKALIFGRRSFIMTAGAYLFLKS